MNKKIEPRMMVRVTEEVLVKQDVDVNIYDLTDNHLNELSNDGLINIIKHLIMAHRGDYDALQKIQEPTLFDSESDTEISGEGGSHAGGVIGAKRGMTSKYHYVYWDKQRGLYRWDVSGHGGGSNSTNMMTEIEVAIEVDDYLDSTNDEKRPRNRDDFPEVKAQNHPRG